VINLATTGEDSATVAVVAGAARGIGRGIALVLGEAGATVYVTDRDTRARPHPDLPGTVEDTAAQVTERGGRGVPVELDYTDDTAVTGFFDRVGQAHGGLDLLVANAFGGSPQAATPGPFWTLPPVLWRQLMDGGVRNHLIAARAAAPLLIERRGLAVLIGYDDPDAEVMANLYYDLAMNSISRLARSIAHDLRPHRVTALAISPGFTRTEALAAAMGGTFPPGTDSVEFPGLAVRALLDDPDVDRHAGRTIPVAELAKLYGFSDREDT
jgi:dehydrogenase/reductase SDR family member 1